ncbi:MAG: hypothetical protein HQ582_23290 [Planctomycetes bacterium]|nr:hypothetical protein [Planctomycetota bacterium]
MSFSPERYKQVARACKVLEILQGSRYGKTTRELADEVVRYMGLASVSLKSIERDVKFWQGYGFPINPHKTTDRERRVCGSSIGVTSICRSSRYRCWNCSPSPWVGSC